jgi:hypothetical protein
MFANYTQLYALQHQIRHKGNAFFWNSQIFQTKNVFSSTFFVFFNNLTSKQAKAQHFISQKPTYQNKTKENTSITSLTKKVPTMTTS